MRFLIIIFCLLSEKFIPHYLQKTRQTWLENYSMFLKKKLPAKFLNSSSLSLYFGVLISLTLISTIFFIQDETGSMFVLSALFNFIVFYLCLGEHNLFFMNANSNHLLKPKDYILAINQEFLAIILLFFIFGPLGAMIYRVTLYFSELQEHEPRIKDIKDFLDWFPSRMTGLLFLMVGQFQPGISNYFKQLLSPSAENTSLLLQTAEDALGQANLEKVGPAKLEELFTHSCLLLIFILAIYMIGRLF